MHIKQNCQKLPVASPILVTLVLIRMLPKCCINVITVKNTQSKMWKFSPSEPLSISQSKNSRLFQGIAFYLMCRTLITISHHKELQEYIKHDNRPNLMQKWWTYNNKTTTITGLQVKPIVIIYVTTLCLIWISFKDIPEFCQNSF